MKDKNKKVLCETPLPGKKPIRIEQWKFDVMRKAILRALPQKGEGLPFKDLPGYVDKIITREIKKKIGSIGWYTTTVKLALEVRGEIQRVPQSKPQRLIKIE